MIHESFEIPGRGGKPPPPGPASEPEIDLDRLVWDPEYRDQVRQGLNRLG